MRQPGDARSDAALVQAFLAGDRDALGALYDRFAPGLFDTARAMLRDRDGASDVVQEVFCVAATKLTQLRDPERVKPWLYAVARHEIYRRSKRRSREGSSLDAYVDARGDDPMARPDPFAEGAGVVSADLAGFVRDAASGLDEADQLLLELSARQGLVGAELAAAMGVSTGQAHSMLFRMRERLERAVGAVVVARAGRRRCPDLATVLTGWDGSFDVLWRKRIARHIDACDTCQDTRRGAAVLSLAGAAPAFAAPLALRDRTLHAAEAAMQPSAAGHGDGHGGEGDGEGGGDGPDEAVAERAGEGGRASRYLFDADGFPTGLARQRSLVGPLMASLTAVFVIALALWMLPTGSVDGAVSDLLVAPPATSTSTTSTTTTSTSSTTTSTTSTTSSTTSTTTTPSNSTVAATVVLAPPPPTSPPTVVDPPPATTRPPRDTAPPTIPTTTAAPVGRVTTTTVATTTTRPQNLTAQTTTTTMRLVLIAPIIPIRTTTTFEPPR